jgi:phage tail protein X
MSTLQTLVFPNADTPLDLLLFVALKRQVAGLVEDTLARNPGLAAKGPFPPAGTTIVAAVPAATTSSSAAATPVVRLY